MFKKFFKKIIIAVLNLEARLILRAYKPQIIAVTGSVGKTSAKEAIYAVLSFKFNVRKSEKSQNNELGVPLTIIGAENPWYSPAGWLGVMLKGLGLILKIRRNKGSNGANGRNGDKGNKGGNGYPEKLILELGADRPGDIARMSGTLKPDIGVITAIGEIPVHVEFFSGTEEVAREKSKLVESLSAEGQAILNGDDDIVLEMKDRIKAPFLIFGFDNALDIYASEYNLVYRTETGDAGEAKTVPEGITFKINHNGSTVPVRIHGSFGRHNVYAALAGAAVGIALDMNMVEIAEALSKYASPPGRLKLLEGEKGTWILDDTYNASPQSMHAAIDLLKDLPAKRRIAVIGDMLEIGKFTIQAHQEAGRRLKDIADFVITVGPRAKFVAQELLAKRFREKNIISVSDSREAGRELESILEEGDLILVKGSQAMRMERVVEEIMAHPEDKARLLVRQEPEWLAK